MNLITNLIIMVVVIMVIRIKVIGNMSMVMVNIIEKEQAYIIKREQLDIIKQELVDIIKELVNKIRLGLVSIMVEEQIKYIIEGLLWKQPMVIIEHIELVEYIIRLVVKHIKPIVIEHIRLMVVGQQILPIALPIKLKVVDEQLISQLDNILLFLNIYQLEHIL